MDYKQKDYISEIVELVHERTSSQNLLEAMESYHENDIAEALEFLTKEERIALYTALGIERVSEVFAYLEDATEYFEEIELEKAAEIIENMDSDDAVDILENMDEEIGEKLVSLLDEEIMHDIRLIQSYEEDEIGSKMTTNFISIRKGMTVKEAMKELVSQAEDNDNIYTVYVYNEDKSFYGALDLKDLITARAYVDLEDLISHAYPYVHDHEKVADCLDTIRGYAEDSIPVLDDKNCILGVITAQDIIEVVDEEMADDYAKLAGLTEEEDINETVFDSMKKRLPWLIVLLAMGIGVSAVVGLFESVVQQIAVIVSFQSLILGMAGNVGTQSLAVTIRVLMDEDLTTKQKLQHVFKEGRIGIGNGLLLGLVSFVFLGLYIWLLKDNGLMFSFAVSGCVGISLVIAMALSSLVGTAIPMFLHKIKVDPAVASGPLITTINDLMAVVFYYGLAWLLLIQLLHL